MVVMVNFMFYIFYHNKKKKEKERERDSLMGQDARAGPEHVEASTGLEEVLEDPGELRVLVDVEEVREGLHHLPLLEETRRAFLSPARAGRLRREAFLPPAPPPTSHQRLCLCIPSNQLAKQTQPGEESRGGLGASPIAGVRPWAG